MTGGNERVVDLSDKVSELVDQRSGASQRTVVQIPLKAREHLNLSYDSCIRISLGVDAGRPRLSFKRLESERGTRGNDFKLTSNAYVPLPRRVVRALGLTGEISWLKCETRCVGDATEYNDETTLLYVLRHLTGVYEDLSTLPPAKELAFESLVEASTSVYQSTSETKYSIWDTNRRGIRAELPTELADQAGEAPLFSLFYIDDEFYIYLLSNDESNLLTASNRGLDVDPPPQLNYEKDSVNIARTEDGAHFTVPKQVAQTLWLDEGFTQDWIGFNGLAISRLRPDNPSKTHHHISVV